MRLELEEHGRLTYYRSALDFYRVLCDDDECSGETFRVERTPSGRNHLVCLDCGARHELGEVVTAVRP